MNLTFASAMKNDSNKKQGLSVGKTAKVV